MATRTCWSGSLVSPSASLSVHASTRSRPTRVSARVPGDVRRAGPGDLHRRRPRPRRLDAPHAQARALAGELHPRRRGGAVVEHLDADVAERRRVVETDRRAEAAPAVARERRVGVPLVAGHGEPRHRHRGAAGRDGRAVDRARIDRPVVGVHDQPAPSTQPRGEARDVDVAHLRVAAVAKRGNRTLGRDGDAGGTALTDAGVHRGFGELLAGTVVARVVERHRATLWIRGVQLLIAAIEPDEPEAECVEIWPRRTATQSRAACGSCRGAARTAVTTCARRRATSPASGRRPRSAGPRSSATARRASRRRGATPTARPPSSGTSRRPTPRFAGPTRRRRRPARRT